MAQCMNTMDLSNPEELRAELVRVKKDHEDLESQYNSLLEKLGHMRTTVGERLQQDAEELDRREQQIERLTAQVGDYEAANTTLKEELVTAHADSERVTQELDMLRTEMSKSTTMDRSEDINRLEIRCRELQDTVDTQRVDLDRLQSVVLEERSWKENFEARAQQTEAALTSAQEREAQLHSTIEQEKTVARQLQQAMEEFQLTQERDMRRTVGEMQDQVDKVESELESCKLRLHDTEVRLETAQDATHKCDELEREVKEKNLFIGKLRHEAVILNEHLTDTLRQIRRESSEALVDRRLVTNLILQYLALPRADSKRFEILRLMASVLQWDDEQREKAGLQRSNERSGFSFLGFGSSKPPQSRSPSATGDEVRSSFFWLTQSVSNLFVEFLLSEVERGEERGAKPAAEGNTPFDLHRLAQLDRDSQQSHASNSRP